MKKVLVCDCDQVLWHGISGEEEVFFDENTQAFQQLLLRLYESGVVLCLCSRNDKTSIDASFASSGMLLKDSHFVSVCFDTEDKAKSLKAISEELGLSLDSFVFVDDSDYELGLICHTLPEVTAIKADYSTSAFINEIFALFPENGGSGTERTAQYREQKEREKERILYSSVEEYNASLNTVVICDIAGKEQANRIAELSQRTNKFNLSGKRYDEKQICDFIDNNGYVVLSLSASDKYGDMGIVCAAVIKKEEEPVILSFNVSCRVFRRGFETVLIERIKRRFEGKQLRGVFRPSEKNNKYSDFYTQNQVIPIQ